MSNPAGNYPGRQIFVGQLANGQDAFCLFASGRSEQSKMRYAKESLSEDSSVRILPTVVKDYGRAWKDYYHAVRVHPESGLLVVSNSQAPMDSIMEVFTHSQLEERNLSLLAEILMGLGPEYDNPNTAKRTPRIIGIFYPSTNGFARGIGISHARAKGKAVDVSTQPKGKLAWISTYNGSVDYQPYDPTTWSASTFSFTTPATTAHELANEVFDMSNYIDEKYGDLRVLAIAGVRTGKGVGGWEFGIRNRFNPQ